MPNDKEKSSVGAEIGGAIGREVGKEIGKTIENNITGKNEKGKKRKSLTARRVGYTLGIVCALLFLWIIGNFDNWGWPFITDAWSQVDGVVRVAIFFDLIMYIVFFIYDQRVLFYIGKLISNIIGIIVSIRLLQVFPFDFQYLFGGWTWLNTVLPILFVLGVVGIVIGCIVRTAKLAAGEDIYNT